MLIVGENPSLEISLGRWAEKRSHRICRIPGLEEKPELDPEELLVWVAGHTDLEIPERLGQLAAKRPSLACLPHGAYALARKALNAGFHDYLCIPTPERLLFQRLERLSVSAPAERPVQIKATDTDLHELGAEFRSSIAGEKILALLEAVAPFPTTVLFEGETGSGKEVSARLLHRLSPRCKGPFVVCHLASLSRDLIESELFGHVRGAYTGATAPRRGAIAMADGGTLFLDEVSEAPLDIQVKILRAVQHKTFVPVGSDIPQVSDCRILAATNRDLFKEVQTGRFRQDLYYRLSVYPIRMTPLRERLDGLDALVMRLLDTLVQRLGSSVRNISGQAMDILRNHTWPGNIRELENVLEGALVRAKSQILEPEHLSIESSPGPLTLGPAITFSVRDEDLGTNFNLDDTLENIQAAIIRKALDKAGGNMAEAARLLGIHRSTLHSRLLRISGRDGSTSSKN